VLAEFIVHLPAAAELGVSPRIARKIQGDIFVIVIASFKFFVLIL
jgi:hypothetical protein